MPHPFPHDPFSLEITSKGFQFFAPLYVAANTITFHSSLPSDKIHEILEGQMAHPYFPVPFVRLLVKRESVRVPPEGIRYGDLHIYPFPLDHPQGATGGQLSS